MRSYVGRNLGTKTYAGTSESKFSLKLALD